MAVIAGDHEEGIALVIHEVGRQPGIQQLCQSCTSPARACWKTRCANARASSSSVDGRLDDSFCIAELGSHTEVFRIARDVSGRSQSDEKGDPGDGNLL